MDYQTLFAFDIVLTAVYAAIVLALSLSKRRMTGMRWIAASVILEAAKTCLQLQVIHVMFSRWVDVFFANCINDLSFGALYLGLRWFVLRKPVPLARIVYPLCATFAIYRWLFAHSSPYGFMVVMLPVLSIDLITAFTLFRHATGRLRRPASVAAGLLLVEFFLALDRIVYITRHYSEMKQHLMTRPYLNATMFGIMIVSGCLMMTFIWFFVEESHGELIESSRTDALTGLLNRRALEQEAAREIARAQRTSASLAVMAIDIDFFKSINDRFGHDAGDRALCWLASLLRRELRQTDIVARPGGEEFTVMMPDTSLAAASSVAERLRRALVANPVEMPGTTIPMTFTAGVAVLQRFDTGLPSMLKRADRALYRGKALGRNRVVLAGVADVDHALEREELEEDLYNPLEFAPIPDENRVH